MKYTIAFLILFLVYNINCIPRKQKLDNQKAEELIANSKVFHQPPKTITLS